MTQQYKDTILDEMVIQSVLRYRKIPLIEEFSRESIYKVQYMMNKILDSDNKTNIPIKDRIITLDISSYGGCAFSCLSLIGTIEQFKELGYTIITHINSMAMSAGFFTSIVESKRTMNRHGVGLIHPMLSGTSGSLQSMIDDVEFDKVLWNRLVDITIKYTNFSRDDMEELKKCKTDKYMMAEEMLDRNCIDEII